jgi:hypothetical protein
MAEAKVSEKKAPKDVAELTPSGLAAKEAGELADDASDEEKVAWNDKYLEAKLKARRG